MEADEMFLDEDMEQIEHMRESRKKMNEKDFAKLINKRDFRAFIANPPKGKRTPRNTQLRQILSSY